MKRLLFFLFLLFPLTIFGQQVLDLDSLLGLLPKAKEEISTVELYYQIGQQYENSEPELAKEYYRNGLNLSKKIGYRVGEIKFSHNYTYVLNVQGKFDSSLYYNLKAVELAQEIKDSVQLGKTLLNTGSVYRYLSDYETAADYYQQGKLIFEKIGDNGMRGFILNLLQVLYSDLKLHDRAIEVGLEAMELYEIAGDQRMIGTVMNNLGLSYSKLRKTSEAISLYQQALQIGIETKDLNMQGTALLNLGDSYSQINDYPNMEKTYIQASDLFRQLEAKEGEIIALRGLSIVQLYRKNPTSALDLVKKSVDLALETEYPLERQKSLLQLSNVYFALQDIPRAREAMKQSELLGDRLINEEIQGKTLELEKKYESEKQRNQILQLESQNATQQAVNQKRQLTIWILVILAFSLSAIGMLIQRKNQHKQRLQLQRIKELETEKQLTATEAVLKGEEQERSRLAKDLHDGLGGMLSGIKFSFQTMKGNLILTPENAQLFERSLDMLDTSISEMRRVAHNLMPENLIKFGLDSALRDFFDDINLSGVIQLRYISIGLKDEQIDQTIAISLYRIIQELVNNILKHAEAKQALVQLTKNENLILLDVEDDGKGFEHSKMLLSTGIGWTNIKSRLEYLNAKVTLDSSPGKGSSIHIEVQIP
ncbi:tetratricopeptide repeat-containing sensor histidine kinase [Algoriphagus sp.]|jgi:signal transduction histidine kinase|uniref:tetratricopeptide repeat-containing sensor histidine kinase n=1 Tax=Algoriphagus sp. TaxID=1872435 RepID=UPI002724C7B0|nr:tetratricopeptide repeat-containing sensor histidine kinase [Algoriphagus sp.]MDO8967526.1 tetratricopeptide repeat protein [Algoriphagus sp.]MDP3201836.1 tetratricopeptide repeat protein [Algoriphagus sp.]